MRVYEARLKKLEEEVAEINADLDEMDASVRNCIKLKNAIKELQEVVAMLKGEPVGMLFQKLD